MALSLTGIIGSEAELRAVYKQPTPLAVTKEIGRLDPHCRRFIELSPFICIGTMTPNGRSDVSPRGGEPGFVAVLDDNHLAIPDRPGNNRLDTMLNILKQPAVGLLFFVPGVEDMLRVNGVAQITMDDALMRRFMVQGKPPVSVMVVEVRQAQLHCPKAIKRAGLWDPASYIDRKTLPTLGKMLHDQLALTRDLAELDQNLDKSNLNLY
jgi:PPOX class probable FMN-dependent enzyme